MSEEPLFIHLYTVLVLLNTLTAADIRYIVVILQQFR